MADLGDFAFDNLSPFVGGRLGEYMSGVLYGGMDLLLGVTIGSLADWLFSPGDATTAKKIWGYIQEATSAQLVDNETLLKEATRIFLQLAFTVLLSVETRGIFYGPTANDPLGGCVFIFSVFISQPGFWLRVNELRYNLGNRLAAWESPDRPAKPVE